MSRQRWSHLQFNFAPKVFFVVVSVVYLLPRLIHLDALPVFLDELFHIRLATYTLQGDLLAGSYEGKWFAIKLMALSLLLPMHPVIAVRIGSVFVGYAILIVLFLFSSYLPSPKVGYAAALLYAITPYSLFYDRLALTDGYLALVFITFLLVSVYLARSEPAFWKIVLVMSLSSICVLTKLSGIAFVLTPLVIIPFFAVDRIYKHLVYYAVPSFLAGAGVFALLVLSDRGAFEVSSRAQAFNLLSLPTTFWQNLSSLVQWFYILNTPVLFWIYVTGLIAAISVARSQETTGIITATLLAAVPLLLTTIIYPRYFYFLVAPMALVASHGGMQLMRRLDQRFRLPGPHRQMRVRTWLTIAVAGLLLITVGPQSQQIVLQPANANLPEKIRTQYISGWTSGYGIRALVEFVYLLANQHPDGYNLVRWDYGGQTSVGFDLYFTAHPAVFVKTLHPLDPRFPDEIRQLQRDSHPTYLMINPPVEADHLAAAYGWSLGDFLESATHVATFPRPGNDDGLQLWLLATVQD